MISFQGYEFEQIFTGCIIMDIYDYLMEKGVQLQDVTGVRYLYHDLCHSPMKKHHSLTVANALMSALNGRTEKNDRCGGDAGTLAVTRPDVATQMRFCKEQEVRLQADDIRAFGHHGDIKILTSRISCLQGLKRFDDDSDTGADYIVVELAKNLLVTEWLPDYEDSANTGGIERLLV